MSDALQRELEREIAWRRSAEDEKFWIENFFHIRVPGQGRVLLKLRPAQAETLDLWSQERYTIALKARQIGFSTLVAARSLHKVMFTPDVSIVMLSKGEREAAKLLKKSAYAYKHLPQWMKDRAPRLLTDNVTKMEFDNDSWIESLPSGEDPGRSEAVDIAVVDEWAFLPNPEDAWAAIEPITDVGGRVIGISTANGSGNFFHNHYVSAKTGANSFKAIFWPWSANDDRDDAWYETKRRNMTESKLHQEYPRDDEECFVKSGNPVFDMDSFPNAVAKTPDRGYVVRRDGDTGFTEAKNGPFKLWKPPERGRMYVVGADVAEGLEHGDYSVAHVLDVKAQEVVCVYRSHIDPDLFGKEILWTLGYWYNKALIGVEVNNHGLTTATALRDTSYPNVYYRHTYDERFNSVQRKIGFLTSAKTKPQIIDELRQACRDGFVLPDSDTIEEMRTYSRDERGRMSGSPFDDHVMSFAIGMKMIDHVYAEEYNDPEPLDPMSMKAILEEALAAGDGRDRLMTDTSRTIATRG